jgi:hypothetical protein
MKMGGMCFNWKVLAGLAGVGLAVWIVAPNLVGAALPLLLVAACPLSMLLMRRGIAGGQCPTPTQQAAPPERAGQPVAVQLTRDEQLAELKAQQALLEVRQGAIAREIAGLERVDGPAVREAEAVAQAADERSQHRA